MARWSIAGRPLGPLREVVQVVAHQSHRQLSVPGRDRHVQLAVDAARGRQLFLALLNEGVMLAPRLMGCISTAHTDADLDLFIDALDTAVASSLKAARA